MRAHVIENGIVTNTIEVASLDVLPNLIDANLGGSIGWAYDGVSVYEPAEKIKTEKLAKIDATYQSMLYTNTTALFPSGSKVIQLRNEKDFDAFKTQALASFARLAAKRDEAKVKFRTEDNVTQELPAAEFVPVALDILDAKQALWDVRTAHKDALLDLTTIEDVTAYDITAGWPTENEPVWVMEERATVVYKDMIRRRAARLVAEDKGIEALTLLKTIGE